MQLSNREEIASALNIHLDGFQGIRSLPINLLDFIMLFSSTIFHSFFESSNCATKIRTDRPKFFGAEYQQHYCQDNEKMTRRENVHCDFLLLQKINVG